MSMVFDVLTFPVLSRDRNRHMYAVVSSVLYSSQNRPYFTDKNANSEYQLSSVDPLFFVSSFLPEAFFTWCSCEVEPFSLSRPQIAFREWRLQRRLDVSNVASPPLRTRSSASPFPPKTLLSWHALRLFPCDTVTYRIPCSSLNGTRFSGSTTTSPTWLFPPCLEIALSLWKGLSPFPSRKAFWAEFSLFIYFTPIRCGC